MHKKEKLENLEKRKEKHPEYKRMMKKIRGQVYKAVYDYHMLEEGDRVMVCLSGGKDSYTMLDMFINLQKSLPFKFDIVAVNLDQKQPGFPEHILPEYLENIGVDYRIIEKDTYSIVKAKLEAGKTMCSLCSRLRRGTLYGAAKEMGITKIALGHHRDDIIETMFLNIFFAGKMETMPAKFQSNDGMNTVIRPLCYVKESDIKIYSEIMEYPIIPCTLCGSQENLQRKKVKQMLTDWEKDYPNRKDSIFKALTNVAPSHLLDTNLFDFEKLQHKVPEESEELVKDYIDG